MSTGDVIAFAVRSLRGYRRRSILVLVAMAIGVAAVVILTSLGEGARRYIQNEFSALGTNLLVVLPGRSETTGGPPPLLGETPRDLTLEDAIALTRCHSVRSVAPVIIGSAPVAWRGRIRDVPILGSTHQMLTIRHMEMGSGSFLPPGDPERSVPVCVIGGKVKNELFGSGNALGVRLRIGDSRFRVIGIIGSQSHSLGLDVDDMVTIPVASARALFDSPGLFRVLVEARSSQDIPRAKECILETIRARHDGEDDVTIITQDAVLSTFDRILSTLTLSIGGIAAVSLGVAGILIMNVMLVSVSERTSEVGLLKAIGATRRGILMLFLAEAVILSLTGAVAGLGLGLACTSLMGLLYPSFPVGTPLWAPISALAIALGAGLFFGALPASRAARLEPVTALSRR